MYDIGIVDKAVTDKTGSQLLDEAIDAFFEDKPEFLFISIDETDHIGHVNGHETKQFMDMITHYDAMIGRLIDRLRAENLLDETVVIVTADHGGIKDSHGGDSAAELEIPIILYGGNVTKGKVLERTNFICDIAATVGGLLGVELPQECVGKFICEAFEPVTGKEYVPMPFIFPVDGMFKDYADVTITGDVDGGEIYYTLDGSVPTTNSIKYEGAFEVDKSVQIQAVVYKNGQSGELAEAMLRIVPKDEIPKVAYKYYPNMMKKNLPDFKGLGKPSREGYVHEFSLDELNVEEEDHFAVLFTAKLKIDEDGEYTFGISSDDGAKLYVNGKEVIDNDGSHSTNMKYGKIMLTQGIQEIKVEYFDDYMGQDLMLCYKTKDKPLQVLPFAQLVK